MNILKFEDLPTSVQFSKITIESAEIFMKNPDLSMDEVNTKAEEILYESEFEMLNGSYIKVK